MEARNEDASSVGAVQMFETNWNNGMPAKFCAVSFFFFHSYLHVYLLNILLLVFN